MFISELLKDVIDSFKGAGIESPVLDARILFSFVLNMENHELTVEQEKELTPGSIKKIKNFVKRRLKFEPVAYITGNKEFYSLDFKVNKNVLIPRPETELLVDLSIYYAEMNAKVLDLGTGSGAIAVSLKYNRKDLEICASDISENALKTAKRNANKILGAKSISFFPGNLFEPFQNMSFNMIVSNPPYINPGISGSLQKELSYEPEIALYSDDNGEKIVREIIKESKKYLKTNGMLIIEIGYDMKKFVEKEAIKNNYSVSVLNDYSNLPRVAVFKIN